MALSVSQLLTPVTKEQALELVIDLMVGFGFKGAASYQAGSWRRSTQEMVAELYADLTQTQVVITQSGFNDEATGDGLTLFSASHYDNTRTAAVKTQGEVILSDPDSLGPFTINVGDIVVADTVNDFRYRNITGGTLSAGSTLTLDFEAEVAGANRDVADNTITSKVEGPGGVTYNNPPIGADPWITRSGADAEQDAELTTRNSTKWATLAKEGPPGAAYVTWALEADASITRVFVDDQNPRGAGTIDVYVAGVDGAVTSAAVTAVQNYIDGVTDGVGRKPLGADVLVINASELSVVVTGTIYIIDAFNTAATQAAINAAVETLFEGIPIGGTVYTGSTGFVLLSDVFSAINAIEGVVNPALTLPAADTAVALGEVPVEDLTPAFTFTSV